MRLLVTRPLSESESLASELTALGHEPLVAPLLEIEPAGPAGEALFAAIDAIALTSGRALAFLSPPAAALALPLFAVGPASAAAAREAGFSRVEEAAGDAGSLAELLRRRLAPGTRILHPGGVDLARDLGVLLEGSGLTLERRVVYRARTPARLPDAAAAALADGSLDGALFFSPRTAKTFVRLALDSGLAARTAALSAFCLSPAVAAGLTGSVWREIHSASRPDRAGMLEIIGSRPC